MGGILALPQVFIPHYRGISLMKNSAKLGRCGFRYVWEKCPDSPEAAENTTRNVSEKVQLDPLQLPA